MQILPFITKDTVQAVLAAQPQRVVLQLTHVMSGAKIMTTLGMAEAIAFMAAFSRCLLEASSQKMVLNPHYEKEQGNGNGEGNGEGKHGGSGAGKEDGGHPAG